MPKRTWRCLQRLCWLLQITPAMDAAAGCKRKRIAAAGASGSGCRLPDEIVEDILSRLPAKALQRFQCVSRSFHAVMASRAFQDAHFRRHNSNGHPSLFIRLAGLHEPFCTHRPGSAMEMIMSTGGHLPQGSVFPVSKSCRGLVLLKNLQYHMHYVWNPSTGDIAALPDRIPLRVCWLAFTRQPAVSYGLGYCSATQQHKVLRMYYHYENQGSPASICEVFTLNQSAYWRPVATKPPFCIPHQNWRQGAVLCNGNLHFLHDNGNITAFDMEDETFHMLKPPQELQLCSDFEITELAGCLCAYILRKEWNGDQSRCPLTVWMLRDYYAAAGNWEKLISFINWGAMPQSDCAMLKSSWIAPLDMYYDASGQRKIMFATGSCKVFIIDTKTGASEILFSPNDTIIGECRDDWARPPTVGLFEESLARVGKIGENTIFMMSLLMKAWSEVLSQLPSHTVSSLNQVCRGWRAMINSKHFMATHYLYWANLNKSPQMMFINGKPHGFERVKNFIDGRYVMPPLVQASSRIVCSKPCHGLTVGSISNYDFVCNPVTGYFKALPLDNSWDWKGISLYDFLNTVSWENNGGNFLNTVSWENNGDAMFAGRIGLGYEQESSRHVMVRLAYKERNRTTRYYKMVCYVRYVEDMIWKEIDPPSRPIADTPPAHVKNKLYWMADTELGQRSLQHEIVMLDVTTRKFEVLQGPPFDHDNSEHVSIIELQEVVCVTYSHQSTGSIKIWAMEDIDTWSIKYNIELRRFSPEYSPATTTPLAIDPMDGRILLSTGRALGYYDPRNSDFETILRLGKHTEGMKFVPVLFQESLVKPCDFI